MTTTWIEKLCWVLLAVAFVACIPLVIWAVRQDRSDHLAWEAFKVAHNCKVTSRTGGSVMPTFGIDTSGRAIYGMTTTPSKTGWTCDDGVTYYK